MGSKNAPIHFTDTLQIWKIQPTSNTIYQQKHKWCTITGVDCVCVYTFTRVGGFFASPNLPLLGIRAACSWQNLMCLSAAFSLNLR